MQKPLDRILSAFLILGMVVGVVGAPQATNAVTANTIIKGSGPTLYWHATDGKRYVFPNTNTFYSWFSSDDFRRVQTLSDSELAGITIGGNVTYRPGYRLVKVTTDPKVYAVSRYGTLRWVTSEAVAEQLYGAGWRWRIDDIPDMFFTNYTLGSPIYSASDYNVSNEYNGVSTPSDSLRLGIIVDPPRPPVLGRLVDGSALSGAITSRLWNGSSETVTYMANLTGANGIEAITIRVYHQTTGEFLGSCVSTTVCVVNLTSGVARTHALYATASDSFRTITSNTLTVSYGGTTAPPTEFRVTNVTSNLDTSRANACNLGFGVVGSITATRAGTVAYRWERSDNAIAPIEYVTFDSAGTKTVSADWFLTGNYSGWMRLKIITPNEIASVRTPIVSNCVTPEQRVTDVTASVSPTHSMSCSQRFMFTGVITADRAGVVRYTWDRSDNALDTNNRSVTFTGPGSITVTDTWDLSAPYTGWEQLRVLSPGATASSRANFSLRCAPTEPFRVTSAYVSVDNANAFACGYHQFIFTGTVTANQAGTVRYRFERSDGGQSSEDQYLTFTGAGTQAVNTSWNFSGNYPYSWVRLRILSPQETVSNNAEISLLQTCGT